jgi:hypothetical protein
VSPAQSWQSTFVAFSVLLREPLATAVEALGAEHAAATSELVRELGAASKEARARVVARIAVATLTELDGAVTP